jgi:NADPH:quinone reductase-like Zn-dependent oxidoreductase
VFSPTGPFVMGSDGAGTVEAVGTEVVGWRVGDTVTLDPLLSCGACESCRSGRVILCPALDVLGGPADGTFADLVAVPARNVHRVPRHLDLAQAAALPMALSTAYTSLFAVGGLTAGETLLVHGIGGGVAQVGAQLAVAAGATVIATSSNDDKLKRAQELGVAHTINYRDTDVQQAVRDLVGDAGVDLVLDGVGGRTLVSSLRLAAMPGGYGRVVTFGRASGADVEIPADVHGRSGLLVGRMGDPREVAAAWAFLGAHRITPATDHLVRLEDVAIALDLLREGSQNGKILLDLA